MSGICNHIYLHFCRDFTSNLQNKSCNDLQMLTSDEFILSYDNESCQRMMKKNQIEKKKSDR